MDEMILALRTQGCCPITGAKLKPGRDGEIIRFKGREKVLFLSKKAVENAAATLHLVSVPYRSTSVLERGIGIVGVLDYNSIPRNLAAQLYLDSEKKFPELIDKPHHKKE